MKVNWKEFRKNHPEDFCKCCSKIYLKCKCKKKVTNHNKKGNKCQDLKSVK